MAHVTSLSDCVVEYRPIGQYEQSDEVNERPSVVRLTRPTSYSFVPGFLPQIGGTPPSVLAMTRCKMESK